MQEYNFDNHREPNENTANAYEHASSFLDKTIADNASRIVMALSHTRAEHQSLDLAKQELAITKEKLLQYRIKRSRLFRTQVQLEKLLPRTIEKKSQQRYARSYSIIPENTLNPLSEQSLLQRISQEREQIHAIHRELVRLTDVMNIDNLNKYLRRDQNGLENTPIDDLLAIQEINENTIQRSEQPIKEFTKALQKYAKNLQALELTIKEHETKAIELYVKKIQHNN